MAKILRIYIQSKYCPIYPVAGIGMVALNLVRCVCDTPAD